MKTITLTIKFKSLHEAIEALEKALVVGCSKCKVSKSSGIWSLKIIPIPN